ESTLKVDQFVGCARVPQALQCPCTPEWISEEQLAYRCYPSVIGERFVAPFLLYAYCTARGRRLFRRAPVLIQSILHNSLRVFHDPITAGCDISVVLRRARIGNP